MANYPTGLIRRPRKPHQWLMGEGKASRKLGADAADLQPSGDWWEYDSERELQKRYGFETYNCTNFAWLLALIALAKRKGYEIPHNLSERYTGVVTGTQENYGNDPWHVIEQIATQFGVVAEEVLPWSEGIRNWRDYYSPNPMDELIVKLGQTVLEKYEIEPEWVFPLGSGYSPKEKAARIKAALKRGPVVASVRAWEKRGRLYTKDPGALDTHLVWLPKHGECRDQYEPFKKKLDPLYDHEMAIVLFMRENPSGIPPFKRSYLLWLLKKAWRDLMNLTNRI